MLVLREETARQQDLAAVEDVADVFKPFDEDPEVFIILSCVAISTMNLIPKSCRREVPKCYVEAVNVVTNF